jgi:hypothetical protein
MDLDQEQAHIETMRGIAQIIMREANDTGDALLDLARELRELPEFADPITRIIKIYAAIRTALTAAEAGRVLAILADQIVDREILDQGVPK